MKICEDCIKKDVCKYQAKVEKFESDIKLPEPLESGISCKYKRTEPCAWSYNVPCSPPTSIPDYTTINPNYTTFNPGYTWHGEPCNTRLEAGS